MQNENEIKKEIRTRIESATLLQNRNGILRSNYSRFKKRGFSALPIGKENMMRNQSVKMKLRKNQHFNQQDIKTFVNLDLNEDENTRKKYYNDASNSIK